MPRKDNKKQNVLMNRKKPAADYHGPGANTTKPEKNVTSICLNFPTEETHSHQAAVHLSIMRLREIRKHSRDNMGHSQTYLGEAVHVDEKSRREMY